MTKLNEIPELNFFRSIPNGIMARPPLCSSLQNLESCFYFISLGRFPHALVMCASSVESAIKSVLNIEPNQFMTAEKLFTTAIDRYPDLSRFTGKHLESFRFARNRIIHYGFSPQDDEESANLLLEIGFPFLNGCYTAFFGFDLVDGLVMEIGEQFAIALEVYRKSKLKSDLSASGCFLAFSHQIRFGIRRSLMANWENATSNHAEEIGAKFDLCYKRKKEIESAFGAVWFFDCAICHDINTFGCEIDEEQLKRAVISLKRGMCASCDLFIPNKSTFLADALCTDQIAAKRADILRDFGIEEFERP